MTLSQNGHGGGPAWTDDGARAHAFRELVAAVSACDTYTSAVEAAARPIAVGLGAALMIGLLDPGEDVVHPLGIYDPLPPRATLLEGLFAAPFDHGGFIGRALDEDKPVHVSPDEDAMRAGWPEYAEVADELRLRELAIAPFATQGGVRGVIWAGRAEDEPSFAETDLAFLSDAGIAVALAVHAGSLQEALQRAAGRRAPVVDAGAPRGGQERRRETLLSERERDVLRLLASGHTNREVADELKLSVRTAEWHRARVQWKLGVSGRADLTRVAREQGV